MFDLSSTIPNSRRNWGIKMFELQHLSLVENAYYLTIVFNGGRTLPHVIVESTSLTKGTKG